MDVVGTWTGVACQAHALFKLLKNVLDNAPIRMIDGHCLAYVYGNERHSKNT